MTIADSNNIALTNAGAATWFANATASQWTNVPMGGATYFAALDNVFTVHGYPNGTGGKISAWNGACSDQVRRRIIHPQVGGHTPSDGAGNEVFSVDFSLELPVFEYLRYPTLTVQVGGGGADHAYLDGQPRAVHGWNSSIFFEGRAMHSSMSGLYDSGGNSDAVYSFDMAAALAATPSTATWSAHGRAADLALAASFQGQSSAVDKVRRRIWVFPQVQQAGAGFLDFYSMDPPTNLDDPWPTATLYQNVTNVRPEAVTWAIYVDDGDYILCAHGFGAGGMSVVDPNNPQLGFQSITVANDQVAFYADGSSPVHHNGSVYTWRTPTGAGLNQLTLPAGGNWQSGTFTWSVLSGGGVTPAGTTSTGPYSKFNIIDDMGNGQAGIFVIVGEDSTEPDPYYFWKLP